MKTILAIVILSLAGLCHAQVDYEEAQRRMEERKAAATQPAALMERLKTLQVMVEKLRDDNGALKKENAELKRELAALKAKATTAPAPPKEFTEIQVGMNEFQCDTLAKANKWDKVVREATATDKRIYYLTNEGNKTYIDVSFQRGVVVSMKKAFDNHGTVYPKP